VLIPSGAMTKKMPLVISLLLIAALFAFGQAPETQQSKPGPEVQKLAYYLGTLKGEGEAKPGPFEPAGKLSSTTTSAPPHHRQDETRPFTNRCISVCDATRSG
jgi:hypothetical protein